jgi:signal transduction histidine kinase
MEKEDKLRYLAGILLIISSITHTLQLFVYGFSLHQIGAALYGALYLGLGIFLIVFKENKIVLILCIVLPAIGGTLGVVRFIAMITEENVVNYFIVFHVIVDIIVVPICIYLFLKLRENN